MDASILSSVENFTSELRKQILMYEALEPKSSTCEQDFILIKNEFKKHNIDIEKEELTIDKLVLLDFDALNRVLSKMDIEKVLLMQILCNYSVSREEYKHKHVDVINLLTQIVNLINDYVLKYKEISSNREGLKNNKLELYRKYYNLFSDDQEEIFTDTEELISLMSSLAISQPDQWRILKYVNEANLNIATKKVSDINLVKEVTDYINKYLKDDDDAILIKNQINDELDIDLLPITSETISSSLGIPKNKCLGILSSIVLNSLLNNYQALMNENVINFVEAARIRDMIKTVLNRKIDTREDLINEALNILAINEEYINNNKDVDYKEISSKTISELETSKFSYEDVIKLKTLPILKSIRETIEHINSVDKESEDYQLCCGVLEEFVLAYNNMQDKLNKKRIM